MLVDLAQGRSEDGRQALETAAAIASAKLAKQTHDEKIKMLDLELRRQATARASRRARRSPPARRTDAALKALQAERDLRQAPNDPEPQDESAGRRKCAARRAGHRRRVVPRIVETGRGRSSVDVTIGEISTDAEAGRAAVAATEAARRCTDIEKKANRAAARFAEASGRQSRDTFGRRRRDDAAGDGR